MTRKHTIEDRLILIGNESGQEFIGAWAIPGRLPEMHRYPCESREMFSQRCRLALTGHGTALGWLLYADVLQTDGTVGRETPTPTRYGSSHGLPTCGSKRA